MLCVGGIFKDQIGDEVADGEDVRSLQRIFSVIALDIYSHEMESNSSLILNVPLSANSGTLMRLLDSASIVQRG